jgi:hypothetical protein
MALATSIAKSNIVFALQRLAAASPSSQRRLSTPITAAFREVAGAQQNDDAVAATREYGSSCRIELARLLSAVRHRQNASAVAA